MLALADTLPYGMGETLRLQANYETGVGPPLHEALGIDERSAQRRLTNARKAFWKLTDDEVDDG
jgi:hypothetical protein